MVSEDSAKVALTAMNTHTHRVVADSQVRLVQNPHILLPSNPEQCLHKYALPRDHANIILDKSLHYALGFRLPMFHPQPRSTLTTLGVTAAVSGTRRKMKDL